MSQFRDKKYFHPQLDIYFNVNLTEIKRGKKRQNGMKLLFKYIIILLSRNFNKLIKYMGVSRTFFRGEGGKWQMVKTRICQNSYFFKYLLGGRYPASPVYDHNKIYYHLNSSSSLKLSLLFEMFQNLSKESNQSRKI